ncbi:histidinol dehydrogenase [Helicobacter pylori]|nr:histidinol dehydrogenase [Helicobacter pylori]
MIETTTRLLTNHQIFLKETKSNATNQINKTESLEAIGQPKRSN